MRGSHSPWLVPPNEEVREALRRRTSFDQPGANITQMFCKSYPIGQPAGQPAGHCAYCGRRVRDASAIPISCPGCGAPA